MWVDANSHGRYQILDSDHKLGMKLIPAEFVRQFVMLPTTKMISLMISFDWLKELDCQVKASLTMF